MLLSRSGHRIHFPVDQEKLEKIRKYQTELGDQFPKFGILIISYNASGHIESTLSRIPEAAYSFIKEIFIFDDCSPDNTYQVASALKENSLWKDKLNIYKNPRNLRYGGNQKAGYNYAINRGIDYVIMLHGDGQYAPEYIPDLILPALEKHYEVVFGSRLINQKDALKGGMPLYKFIGNQILSKFENIILGTHLHEFHSGYRMYSTKFLQQVPFEQNTNDFHFDTQIIIQCRALGVEIHEVPIKTYYGEEECNVNGIRYAKDVVLSVLEYRLHQMHIIRRGRYFVNSDFIYTRKHSPFSSHEKILKKLPSSGKKLLEFGGGNGVLYQSMTDKGLEVICADIQRTPYSRVPEERFINLKETELKSLGPGREFDYVVLSDNLPKMVDDHRFLDSIKRYVKLDGKVIVVVPNIAIWFYRLSLLIGRFNYDNKGILDRKNLHFYTRSTIYQAMERAGYKIESVSYSGLPFEVVFESLGKSNLLKAVDSIYNFFVSAWPTLFAYQFIIDATINYLNAEEGEGKLN